MVGQCHVCQPVRFGVEQFGRVRYLAAPNPAALMAAGAWQPAAHAAAALAAPAAPAVAAAVAGTFAAAASAAPAAAAVASPAAAASVAKRDVGPL